MVEEELKLNSHQLRILRAVMDEFFRKRDDSHLRQMFSMFDRDGNGKLEASELKSVMEQITKEK
jgi:Ca2+-binding EF-hand superfamily protein